MIFFIKHIKKTLFAYLLLSLSSASYAQDGTDFLTGELFVHKLIVNNECTYSLLDTIDFHWRHSSLNDKPSFALINFTNSDVWDIQILQQSISNYLDLKGFSSCLFGALRYQNKLYVLHCLDSMNMIDVQKYFILSPDSIKILPEHRTFLQDIRDYKFVVDTMPPAENSVLDWEILTYMRFIQIICKGNENCFQCKEIPNK